MISLRGVLGRPRQDGPAGTTGRGIGHAATSSEAPSARPAAQVAPASALLARDLLRRRAMVSALVVPDPVRCVECGICSYNCPQGIDVRSHARRGLPVADPACLTCGECVARCPRGTLRFEESAVFAARGRNGIS